MNNLENAIKSETVRSFLLGINQYFVLDRDRGIHDSSETYYDILDYLKYNDEEKTYSLLENCMIEILESEFLEGNDFLRFLGIIWIYNREFSENKLKNQWAFSERFKSNMLKQLEHINNSNSDFLDNINNRLELLKSKYKFII
jgi:hypothetical protein